MTTLPGTKLSLHLLDGHSSRNYQNRSDDKQSTLSRYWTIERGEDGQRNSGTNLQQIRRICRERGCLYEDPEFQAGNKAISTHRRFHHHLQPIVWMRPHELCPRPQFVGPGGEWGEAEMGDLGEAWLLSGVAALLQTPMLLERVAPPEQGFQEGYCGAFMFRFWVFGDWTEVLVDDRLPTHRGRLVFLAGLDPTWFWAPLLEKAYAKLYGCYERLQDGSTGKCLQDLTGGIVQSFVLAQYNPYLSYQVLNSAVPRSTLITATIQQQRTMARRHLRHGLMTHHAYSVTGLARVRLGSGSSGGSREESLEGEEALVRLHCPWGRGEWTGPWSDRSKEWCALGQRQRDMLSVRTPAEGDFWMAFKDFQKVFTHLFLVHLGPDDWLAEPALQPRKPWRAVLARRRWRAGYNAGGGPSYVETTAMNPQFRFQIPRTGMSKCHVVVSVTQQYDPKVTPTRRKPLHAIGFAIYEVPPSTARLTPHFVSEHRPLDVSRGHTGAREMATFLALPPGDYVVMPQTATPDCEAKFLLRILTDLQSHVWEVNDDNLLFRNFSLEFFQEGAQLPEYRALLYKIVAKYPPEVEAAQLLKILKSQWKSFFVEKPSLELCKSLIMLRDFNISGRVCILDVPVLVRMLHVWRAAFQKYERGNKGGRTSSYLLRALLWEAGMTVSNKALECLVLRFTKNSVITAEAFFLALLRLHLAHERYHSIDTKMKSNPLSLEEMILMTIYS